MINNTISFEEYCKDDCEKCSIREFISLDIGCKKLYELVVFNEGKINIDISKEIIKKPNRIGCIKSPFGKK